jgi:hypothetical protein
MFIICSLYKKEKKDIDLIEVLIDSMSFNIIIIGLISTILLLFNNYDTTLMLLFLDICLILVFIKLNNKKINNRFKISKEGLILICFILLMIPFIYQRYEIVDMGQDPGVYPSKAIYIAKEGKLMVNMDIRERLSNNLQKIYDHDNLPNNNFLPATYMNEDKSKFYFQFYNVWPLMLATWGNVFGISKMYYIMVYLYFLIMTLLFYIFNKININIKYCFLGILLLGTSPLLIFMTKFPTTELFQLFLFIYCIYLLVKNNFYDSIKAGLVCIIFSLTHISIFMYLPLIALLIPYIYKTKNYVYFPFITISFLGYLFSLIYGIYISKQYFIDIYTACFQILFKDYALIWGLSIMIIFSIILMIYSIHCWKHLLKENCYEQNK